jgi:hypothetical protein
VAAVAVFRNPDTIPFCLTIRTAETKNNWNAATNKKRVHILQKSVFCVQTYFFGRVRRDTEYGGQHIPPGARVLRSNQSRVWWVLIEFRHT